jgi:L-galactose dehydrogenase
VRLVRTAFDLGINLFDTAEAYGTEKVVGEALAALPRDRVIMATKSRILDAGGQPLSSDAVVGNLERSLGRLRTDHVDLFFLHALQLQHYDYALSELVPALLEQQRRGKIRCLAFSESPPRDPEQAMLRRALEDSCWDVFMLAFHMMNQGARRNALPRTMSRGIGTLLMLWSGTSFRGRRSCARP